MLFQYGLTKIPENYDMIERKASKGIVIVNCKLLLIHTNLGDYKFPGGGLKKYENYINALKREILEECGYDVVSVGDCVCETVEQRYDKFENNKIFRMVSRYFICNINLDNKYVRNLDSYEEEQQFAEELVEIEKAIENNKNLLSSDSDNINPWLARETDVLTYIKTVLFSE